MSEIETFNIGDYIEFGRYYDEPILWRCLTKDQNGFLLHSKYIICLKAFDAAESGKSTKGNSDEEKYGSNKWKASNLREWLNSEKERVKYRDQPPTKSAVWGENDKYGENNTHANDPAAENSIWSGYNAYVDEPGFLINFKQDEKDKINLFKNDGVEDKVFLLSRDELEMFYKSDRERIKGPTRSAVEKSDYKNNGLKSNKGWWYWTCTPFASSGFNVTYVGNVGDFIDFGYFAYYGYGGVVPALYLKSDLCKSGKGLKGKPYII